MGSAFNNRKSREELETIASKPSRDHVFQVTNFEALKTIQNQLQEKIFAIEGELRFCVSGTAPEAALRPETRIPLQKLDLPNLWYPDPQHQLSPRLLHFQQLWLHLVSSFGIEGSRLFPPLILPLLATG